MGYSRDVALNRRFRKACKQIAKSLRNDKRFVFERTGTLGWALNLDMGPRSQARIAYRSDTNQVEAGLGDVDCFAEVLGYEMQIQKIVFNPEKRRFVRQQGWSSSIWDTRQPSNENFVATVVEQAFHSKEEAAISGLIAIAERDKFRRVKALLKKAQAPGFLKRFRSIFKGNKKKLLDNSVSA